MRKVHVVVTGDVQGVFFRAGTLIRAQELGISGWVKNLDDGTLEVVAQGDEDKIRTFIEFLKVGPPKAKVEQIQVEEYKGNIEKGFRRM